MHSDGHLAVVRERFCKLGHLQRKAKSMRYLLFIDMYHPPFQFADDWKYVAMVLDRILLWAFSIACCAGE